MAARKKMRMTARKNVRMTEKNLCVAESKIIGMLKDRYDEPERGE
jgi:hypothetical protein